jgi:mannose/fructose/N-acetylgalactosamine-specific phosphotransferase system component IIB
MKQQVDDDLRIDSRMNVKITQLNISVMHNSDNRKHPAEYLNLTFKNIEVV